MKTMKVMIPAFAGAAFALCSTAQAASPQTGNLTVKIEITKDCQVNAGSSGTGAGNAVLDFGKVGVLNKDIPQATAATGTGSIQVQCTSGTAYDIGLDGGQAKDVNARQMKRSAGPEGVAYQLYKDNSLQPAMAWGNTVGVDTVHKTASGAVETYQVFGVVRSQTTPPADIYNDTVAITVTF